MTKTAITVVAAVVAVAALGFGAYFLMFRAVEPGYGPVAIAPQPIVPGNSAISTSTPTSSVPTVPPKSYTLSTPARIVDPGDGNILKIFRMTITSAGYSPSEIIVSEGDIVELDVIAQGGRYDLNIPGLSTSIDVPDGEDRSVSFLANAKGEFPFACRAYCPNGKEIRGMFVAI